MFTPAASGDSAVLSETETGDDVFVVAGAVAHESKLYRFEYASLTFGNGIYVQSITSGAKLLLVTTTKGGA